LSAPNQEQPSNAHGARRIEWHPVLGAPLPARSVTVTFEGRRIEAREGETLFAALIAAGVRVLRTMPKTGEARGGFCLAGRCPDCLVTIDGVPNRMACLTPVAEGMAVRMQRGLGAWPEEQS
jgi:sarcosine oxidase subunit alpha